MISGGLSTTGIDFPPKMLSLSLGSSVIGGSLSDREPPPVLAVATPAQPGNYDWWGSCEGARAPVTQERPSSETPPSPMAGQLPTLGRRGSTFPSYPHSITHIFARCLYIFGSRCLLQPNSCAPKRWKFWQIDLARSPKPFPHQVDNVLARGPPGQNIRLFGSNLIDCFDSHLFSRTFCFALYGQIILLWCGCSKVIGFTLSNWRYKDFRPWICLLVGLVGYVRIITLLMICHQYPNSFWRF